MTMIEERLTAALTATADSVHEDTLRPLIAPAPRRHRRHVAWAAPIAAAVSVLLVIGLAVAGQLPGTGRGAGPAVGTAPGYYVVSNASGEKLMVRSVATGVVTATVPYPAAGDLNDGVPVVASARNGVFFAAIYRGKSVAERIYRFQVADTGQVSGSVPVPGGLVSRGWIIEAIAASADGSQLAIGVAKTDRSNAVDQIIVIHTATGTRTVWHGGISRLGKYFSVGSLSWTADGRELAVLGQWCQQGIGNNENCPATRQGTRTAEVWALNPASGGGQLSGGHLLLRQSKRNPYIIQAVISPDGSIITAVVLTKRVSRSGGTATVVPGSLLIRQISVATGKQVRVLYRRQLPATDIGLSSANSISLSPDSSGRYWMLGAVLSVDPNKGPPVHFNGWIRDHKLVPLQVSRGTPNSAAW